MEKAIKSLKNRIFAIWDDPCAIFSVFGFVFTSLLGTLLHFLPDVAEGIAVWLIAPINESVWEHLKLIFYPYLIFMIAEFSAYGKETRGFLGAKIRGVLLGEGLIVTAHYLVSGVVGKDVAWVDITLFFIGTLVAYLIPYLMIKRGKAKEFSTKKAAVIFILHIALFCIFTFMTPKLGIFLDPQTQTYGIQ